MLIEELDVRVDDEALLHKAIQPPACPLVGPPPGHSKACRLVRPTPPNKDGQKPCEVYREIVTISNNLDRALCGVNLSGCALLTSVYSSY